MKRPQYLPETNILVRLGSHRASDKLTTLLGEKPQCWYSFYHGYYCAEIPADRVADAREIKGITVARITDPERWHQCLDWK